MFLRVLRNLAACCAWYQHPCISVCSSALNTEQTYQSKALQSNKTHQHHDVFYDIIIAFHWTRTPTTGHKHTLFLCSLAAAISPHGGSSVRICAVTSCPTHLYEIVLHQFS